MALRGLLGVAGVGRGPGPPVVRARAHLGLAYCHLVL